jgi:hypothetical protein
MEIRTTVTRLLRRLCTCAELPWISEGKWWPVTNAITRLRFYRCNWLRFMLTYLALQPHCRILHSKALRLTAVLAVVAAALALGINAEAQQRSVVVNGELLDELGLALIDQLNCGQAVGDGTYVLDMDARTWGFAESEALHPLPDCEATGAAAGESEAEQSPETEVPDTADDCESRYHYFEDRMMYCYGVSPP